MNKNTDAVRELKLTELSKGLPAITPVFGASLAEAGAICFEDQNHSNGVVFEVDGAYNAEYSVFWQEITDQMRRCWNDLEDTTEHAAYGVAFLLILDLTEYTIIRRARKGTGFDYWLGKQETKVCYRTLLRNQVFPDLKVGELLLVERPRARNVPFCWSKTWFLSPVVESVR